MEHRRKWRLEIVQAFTELRPNLHSRRVFAFLLALLYNRIEENNRLY